VTGSVKDEFGTFQRFFFEFCRFQPPYFDLFMKARSIAAKIKQGTHTMKFMIIVRANAQTEAGILPDEKLLAEMGKFNERLVKAGIFLAGEGLQASSKGARVRFTKGAPSVVDGPFAETKELIAGFWLWEVKSKAEAIEWVKQAPFAPGDEIEIRQLFAPEDFGPNLTPDEEKLRAAVAEIQKRKDRMRSGELS
jgi:hypothetical protein